MRISRQPLQGHISRTGMQPLQGHQRFAALWSWDDFILVRAEPPQLRRAPLPVAAW